MAGKIFDKRVLWGLVWILGVGLMLARVGFWNNTTPLNVEDINTYHVWSDFIAAHHILPTEPNWQYPSGVAFLVLVPRLGENFNDTFIGLMLAFDLAGLILLGILARRERRDVGVWVWLLVLPLLFSLPILRFDLVPTVVSIAALVVIHQRPVWFGALVGIGAMVKVWPIVVLFGEWKRRLLLISIVAAGVAIMAISGVSAIAFDNQTGFISNQKARSLQVEAVAASPWQLRETITGETVPTVSEYGTNEVDSPVAETISSLLKAASLAVLLGAAVWWWLRDRYIRRGRDDLTSDALGRDFVFTVVLLLVVTSRVLSPQFMIWLVGLAAVVLTSRGTRLERPSWIVIAAALLTAGLYLSPANIALRNMALLVAAVDASVTMALALRTSRLAPRYSERHEVIRA